MALFTDKQLMVMGGIAAVGVYLAWRKLPDVGNAVNPTNPDNVINAGFDGVYQSIFGPDRTLGTDIYDLFNGQETDTVTGG